MNNKLNTVSNRAINAQQPTLTRENLALASKHEESKAVDAQPLMTKFIAGLEPNQTSFALRRKKPSKPTKDRASKLKGKNETKK